MPRLHTKTQLAKDEPSHKLREKNHRLINFLQRPIIDDRYAQIYGDIAVSFRPR